jgi:hypothetical protein
LKKILAGVIAGLFVAGGINAGIAVAGEPGPNGHNEKGLCTAYFNGQKNGHEEGNGPGPFGALEDDSTDDGSNEDQEDEMQVSDDVFEFCDQYGIMGQPEQNGRFDCRDGEERDDPARDADDDGEIECVLNGEE